jgi:hypothetical protein
VHPDVCCFLQWQPLCSFFFHKQTLNLQTCSMQAMDYFQPMIGGWSNLFTKERLGLRAYSF